MPYYVLTGSQATVSSSYKTAATGANASSGTLKRGKILDMIIGQTANPNSTDTYTQWDVSRVTATGTSTSQTPNPVDSADSASINLGAVNFTAEPTYTSSSSLWNEGINQRGSFRFQQISEAYGLIWPATASNGLGIRVESSTYVGSVDATVFFLE